ncbi:MAG: hypothetical protein QXW62_06570 [Candidatus Methanomethylicaceae archaeon]
MRAETKTSNDKKYILVILILSLIYIVILYLFAYRHIDFSFNLVLIEKYIYSPYGTEFLFCDMAVFNDKCFSPLELYEIGLKLFIYGFILTLIMGMIAIAYIIIRM